MKKCRRIVAGMLLLAIFLFTAGCGVDTTEPSTEGTTAPTVGDIFTEPTEETQAAKPSVDEVDSWGYRDAAEFQYDEIGAYLSYNGDEIAFPFYMSMTGATRRNGVGLLLFINDQMQPYRTDLSDEYKLIHTFSGKNSVSGDIEALYHIYFTPLTGVMGEMASINVIFIADPDFRYSQNHGDSSSIQTKLSSQFAAGCGMYRLKMNADPVKQEVAFFSERVISFSTQYIDTQHEDIAGWTDRELRERVEIAYLVNDQRVTGVDAKLVQYEIPAEQPLKLHLEIWGRPGIEYAVIPFVNNDPVYLQGGSPLTIETKEGQKAVLDVLLDISDTDGEAHVYTCLVPLNVLESTEIGPWMAVRSTPTVYLLTMSREEIIEKPGQN